jgi:hypothetical protein
MELYTVKVEMTLVLATRDGEEPTNEDIAKALANEIKCNGFIAGSKRVKILERHSKIPQGWSTVIPWPTRKSVNKRERYVAQILREDKGDWE